MSDDFQNIQDWVQLDNEIKRTNNHIKILKHQNNLIKLWHMLMNII